MASPLAQLSPYRVRDFTYTGVSVEFLYFAWSGTPGRMRPPKATAFPFSSKMGNNTLARKKSCIRPRLFSNPRPSSFSIAAGAPRLLQSTSQSSGAQPMRNRRATSPESPRERR